MSRDHGSRAVLLKSAANASGATVTSLPEESSTTDGESEGGLTDIQLNFLVVGVLFVVVVVLAIVNLYIKRISSIKRHSHGGEDCGPVHTISHGGGGGNKSLIGGLGGGIGGGSSGRSTRANLLF